MALGIHLTKNTGKIANRHDKGTASRKPLAVVSLTTIVVTRQLFWPDPTVPFCTWDRFEHPSFGASIHAHSADT